MKTNGEQRRHPNQQTQMIAKHQNRIPLRHRRDRESEQKPRTTFKSKVFAFAVFVAVVWEIVSFL